MKQQAVHILKHCPPLYRAMRRIWYATSLRHWGVRLRHTRALERYWAKRSIAEGYWNNQDHPSKHFLVESIAAFSPLHSILEVGCASGPNVCLLARRFPEASIVGVDINPSAVDYGNERFRELGISNAELQVGKADNLWRFKSRSFDIVLTNALLVCIGRDKIREVVGQLLRVTSRALIMMECHCFEFCNDGNGLGFYRDGVWIRDYEALLRPFVPEDQIRVSKIPEDIWPTGLWRRSGALVEVVVQKLE